MLHVQCKTQMRCHWWMDNSSLQPTIYAAKKYMFGSNGDGMGHKTHFFCLLCPDEERTWCRLAEVAIQEQSVLDPGRPEPLQVPCPDQYQRVLQLPVTHLWHECGLRDASVLHQRFIKYTSSIIIINNTITLMKVHFTCKIEALVSGKRLNVP